MRTIVLARMPFLSSKINRESPDDEADSETLSRLRAAYDKDGLSGFAQAVADEIELERRDSDAPSQASASP
jgi:hypothetical protein